MARRCHELSVYIRAHSSTLHLSHPRRHVVQRPTAFHNCTALEHNAIDRCTRLQLLFATKNTAMAAMTARSILAVARPSIKQVAAKNFNFSEIRDVNEVNIMRAWLLAVGAGAVYSVSQQLMSSRAGSFFDVNTRGDAFKQLTVLEQAAMREGRNSTGSGFSSRPYASNQHTMWWRLAHLMG